MSAIAVSLRAAAKRFPAPSGGFYTAVRDICLEVREGEFLSVVGPSGCGKSTLLNMVAGLGPPSAGHVEVFGQQLAGLNRRAGYLFQQDALLPWKTVLDNVVLGLQFRDSTGSRADHLTQGREWLRRVGLEGFENHFPGQLSGGMRKRAALAQNWIVNPDILLMDEPFSALDIHTRHRMESELLDLWSASGKTVIFVTHDLEEAIALSDRVAVLSAGPESTVVATYGIPLARPRQLEEIRTQPEFVELYKLIWAKLREEVHTSHARGR